MSEGLGEDLAALLAEAAPGPELAAALAGIDRKALWAHELALVVQARQRMVSYLQGLLMADVLELGLTPWSTDQGPTHRMNTMDKYSGDQVGVTLTRSARDGEAMVALAQDVIRRLPSVHHALCAGRIDLRRAEVFSYQLALLDDTTANRIVATHLPTAGSITPERLRRNLRRAVIKADPDQARRRYQEAVAKRSVHLGLSHNGTAMIDGRNLPVPAVLAASNYIDRLARAAKAAGDPRHLGQLRADVVTDLLQGKPLGTAPSLDALTAQADAVARAGKELRHPVALATSEALRAGHEHASPEREDDAPPAPPPATAAATATGAATGTATGTGPATATGTASAAILPAPRRGVCDIVVDLWTLLSITDDPGLIPGWGPVLADISRQIALDPDEPTAWRFNVVERGRLLTQLTTTRRPAAQQRAFVKTRDGTCRWPGCDRPAAGCDDDHLTPHAKRGRAHHSNLGALCEHHHGLRHQHDIDHSMTLNNMHWFTSPDGRRFFVPNDGLPLITGEDIDDTATTPCNQYIPQTRHRPDAPWRPLM